MKIILITILILTFGTMNFAQDNQILLADGTADEPKKYDLQPKVSELSRAELDTVKSVALEKEIELKFDPKAKSSEESGIPKDYELLDVAEGFFISREIECRAYLYTAYNQKMKRFYQGILVLDISNNGTKYTLKAHYVYEFRGDKFIRNISDMNNNFLSELAIFSEPSTAKYKQKIVTIIEFSPNGISNFGFVEIYSRRYNKQKTPKTLDKNKPAKKVYIPPTILAAKLFVVKKLGGKPSFNLEEFKQTNDVWNMERQSSLASLQTDKTDYIQIVAPNFPKGIGEK